MSCRYAPRPDEVSPSAAVLYSLDSGNYRKLTETGGYPVWLSDSRRLPYFDDEDMKLVDSRTGEIQVLSDVDFDFSISSDDRTIYFARDEEEPDIGLLTFRPAAIK